MVMGLFVGNVIKVIRCVSEVLIRRWSVLWRVGGWGVSLCIEKGRVNDWL